MDKIKHKKYSFNADIEDGDYLKDYLFKKGFNSFDNDLKGVITVNGYGENKDVRILENSKIIVNECVILNNDFQETQIVSDLNLCFCSNTDKSLKYKYECLSLNIK